jgi:hypothetical protein
MIRQPIDPLSAGWCKSINFTGIAVPSPDGKTSNNIMDNSIAIGCQAIADPV